MDRLVDVYPYRRDQKEVKLLILKRAPDVIYAGQWRMVGGKIKADEKAYEAGLRELQEETTLQPKTFWTLPYINQFYDPNVDRIRSVPAFAAELQSENHIALNHEHIDSQWITGVEIASYIQWPEQQRLMHLLISIVTDNQLIDEWIIKN